MPDLARRPIARLLTACAAVACVTWFQPLRGAPIEPLTVGDIAPPGSARSAGDLRQGASLIRQGKLDDAEAAFRRALETRPDLEGAWLGLAEISLRRGKPADAEERARKATTAKPNSATAWVGLGNVLTVVKRLDDAEQAYRKALTLDADLLAAHMAIGNLLLHGRNDPQAAAAAFERAVQLAPKDPAPTFALGAAYATGKNFDKAVSAFEKAATLSPKDPVPAHTLGRVLAAEKKFPAAVKQFTRALEIDATFLPARLDRADVLAEQEKNVEAAADYQVLLRQQSRDAQLWLKLALVTERLKKLDEAARHYQKALSLNPDLALAYNNLAWMAVAGGRNLDQALAWSSKAVSLAGSVPQFQDTLGWIHRARGDLGKAQAVLEAAAKLAPPQASIHYHLGIIHQERGARDAAVAAFNKALEIEREFAEAADARKRLSQLSR